MGPQMDLAYAVLRWRIAGARIASFLAAPRRGGAAGGATGGARAAGRRAEVHQWWWALVVAELPVAELRAAEQAEPRAAAAVSAARRCSYRQ
jgi:hypothetical protein